MNAEKSLRFLAEKWLTPTITTPIRVTRFGRTRANRMRYVCVEALRPGGSVALYFFRHVDGTWSVFPPETGHPSEGTVSALTRTLQMPHTHFSDCEMSKNGTVRFKRLCDNSS